MAICQRDPLWAKWYSFKIRPYTPGPQIVTIFGDRAFQEMMTLK